MIPLVPFHFVRHGETDWNKSGRMQGRRDIALNAAGEAQAEKLRPQIAGHGFCTIATSPLVRARRTAEILNRDLKLPLHAFDGLQEFDVGPYEGTEARDWFMEWRLGRPVAGVESFADFATRIRTAMQQVLALPGPVLVVAHGGVVWALEHLMGLPVETDLANTRLAHFRPSPDATPRWRIDVLETDVLETGA